MTTGDYLDLNGTAFQEEQLRELKDGRYTYLDGLETVLEQNWMEYGAYRPHRFLPAQYVTLQDQEGYTIPHGAIVAAENIRSAGGGYNASAGLGGTGQFAHALNLSSNPMYASADHPIYGYDRTLDGVLVPCNGSTAAIDDYVTTADVTIERMLSSGAVAVSGDVNTTVALQRAASQTPIGVVSGQLMRETAGANMTYRLNTYAYSVCRKGVLHIPYVLKDAARINTPNGAPGGDAGYRAVVGKHQFMLIDDMSLMKSEATPRVDGYGKLILTASGTYPTKFGRIISWTNKVNTDLMSKVDGMPGFQFPGVNTGGLTRRLFDFIYQIRKARSQGVTINEIVADVNNGAYGMVKVLFDTCAVIS